MMTSILQVALGGSIGAVARFTAGLGVARLFGAQAVPMATLGVNVIGCFLMGLLFVYLTERNMMQLSPVLLTGILGGFTTFSAFSLDAYAMLDRGQGGLALLYVGATVALSLGALAAGVALMRGVLA